MRNRLLVAVALAIAMSVPSFAQAAEEITQSQVDEALERRQEASASLEEMTARFEDAIADETLTRERIVALSKSVSRLEQEIGIKRVEVLDLVIARYMAGGSLGTERVFTARTFTDLPVQDEYFELMNARDVALLHGLEAAEALHLEQQRQLDDSLARQKALVIEIGDLTDEIIAQLEEADTHYNAIAIAYEVQEEEKRRKAEEERRQRAEAARIAAEEAARQATSTTSGVTSTTTAAATSTTEPPGETTSTDPTTSEPTSTTEPPPTTTTTRPPAPPPIVTDGKTCPINAATSFTDSWGAPRSGGRLHKGVDMMAARNAPVVAIESGTVTRTSDSSLGGISIYFTGISGNRYYYAHLEALAPGVSGGTTYGVGELVGHNGSSGNASYSAPHLHFQYAPPGSDWINPYPLVKALCG